MGFDMGTSPVRVWSNRRAARGRALFRAFAHRPAHRRTARSHRCRRCTFSRGPWGRGGRWGSVPAVAPTPPPSTASTVFPTGVSLGALALPVTVVATESTAFRSRSTAGPEVLADLTQRAVDGMRASRRARGGRRPARWPCSSRRSSGCGWCSTRCSDAAGGGARGAIAVTLAWVVAYAVMEAGGQRAPAGPRPVSPGCRASTPPRASASPAGGGRDLTPSARPRRPEAPVGPRAFSPAAP